MNYGSQFCALLSLLTPYLMGRRAKYHTTSEQKYAQATATARFNSTAQ